jgi:HAD superfamily hydrolase (TIGR01509 family)
MNYIQSIIFDMDGLMLDTENLSMQAWEIAAEEVEIEFNEDVFLDMIGRNSKGIRSVLKKYIENEDQREAFYKCARINYHQIITAKPIPIKPGLTELLDFLEEHKISKAVATSTKSDMAEKKLKSLGLYDRFSSVVTGDQVKRGKPDPEIYLMAANKLGASPEQCVVLEDSENGIRAASAAGTCAIMIPDLIAPSEEMRKLTYKIFDSINEFLVFFKTSRKIG